jgi:peptidoglycan/LPS O-acetylase OafA/YrhL
LNNNNPTITALHATRFIAAFCVIVYHYGKSAVPFNLGILNTIIQNGGFAVSYFFALSGFIMMYAYYQNNKKLNAKDFWIARFARIYPVYFLSFLFVLLTMLILNGSKPKGISIILQALCLQAWKPGISMEINYVSWSIAVEVLFYFVFPFLFNHWQKKSLTTILFQALIFWLLSLGLHIWLVQNSSSTENANVGQFIAFFPLWHLNSFILGSAAALYYLKKLKPSAYVKYFSPTLIVGSLVLIYIIFVKQPVIMGFLANGGIIPVFILLIFGLALNDGLLSKIFSLRPFVWLGEISYGFYLWQFFIYLFFEEYIIHDTKNFNSTQFYIYILTLVSFSALSYHIFEVPLRKYIKLKFSQKNRYN